MSGPWEKFQQRPAANNEGPWNKFAQQQAAPEEPGLFRQIDNALRVGANGVTFDFVDKLSALMSSGNYDDNIKKERAATEKAKRDLGMAALPIELAGGIAGAIATGGGSLVARGGTLGAKAGLGALEGAGYGALAAAGKTDDGNYMKSLPEGAAVGAALGGALPYVTKGVAKAVSPLAEQMQNITSQRAKNLALAEAEGIPLTAGMRTASPNLKRAESVASQIPLGNLTGGGTEGAAAKFREAVSKQFMSTPTSDLSPDVLAAVKNAMGGEFNSFAARNSLTDAGLLTELGAIAGDAKKSAMAPISEMVERNARNIAEMFSVQHNGAIPGEVYQGMRQYYRQLRDGYEKGSHEYQYLDKLKKALDGAFDRSINAADQAAWKDLNKRYSSYKTVEKAMGGAGSAASGNLSPLAFARTVQQEVGPAAWATGKGNYTPLAHMADDIFRNVPDSGTAGRNFMTKLLEGGGLAGATGVGAGAGAGALAGGLTGAAVGMAFPVAAANLVNSKTFQKYLANQFLTKQREEKLRELLQKYGTSGLLAVGY